MTVPLDALCGGDLAVVGSAADAARNPGGHAGIVARPINEQTVDTPHPRWYW
jgi:hypothetical protein